MSTSNLELRTLPARLELRASSTGPGTVTGTAASYNTLSVNLGDFYEILWPGCFDNAIRRGDPTICTQGHDPDLLLGRTENGTLRLNADDTGLQFSCDLPNTTLGRDVKALVSRQDLQGCSFQFVCDRDEWKTEKDDAGNLFNLRIVKDLHLYDVTLTAVPAYPRGTSVAARSFGNVVPECVLAECRSFSTGVKTGRPTQREIDLYNLRARALKIAIEMDN